MDVSGNFIIFILLLLLLFSNPSLARTVEVNDATSATAVEGVRLTLFIGDTVVLKHKNLHAIYVFRSWRAFESCQLAKATVFHLPCNATFFKVRARCSFVSV
ncbi:hypothetical protein ZOSMA_375G00140 [Zostera marina]|uniref:Uncharacterized protein n=1 Tax=Zostera marina TaxID=29655 RepID=A0A0K9P7Z9_ZOSMR|nr:hypothetical protein ZOSMA_375G00140 [Zostera marina]